MKNPDALRLLSNEKKIQPKSTKEESNDQIKDIVKNEDDYYDEEDENEGKEE